MKVLSSLLLVLLALTFSQRAFSQSFNLGSTELDLHLTNVNKTASLNLSLFKSDLSNTYHTPSAKVDYLFSLRLQPAEVFLVLEFGRLSGKSIDLVVKTYQEHKGQGWGVIAKNLGIRPGSPEFHALKNNAKSRGNSQAAKGKAGGHPEKGKGKKH